MAIKKADKGGIIVIMNTSDYIQEVQRQLNDTLYYCWVPENRTSIHMKEIQSTIHNIWRQDEIGEKCKEYQADFEPRTVKFYLLPKIHKKNAHHQVDQSSWQMGVPRKAYLNLWTTFSNHWSYISNRTSKTLRNLRN